MKSILTYVLLVGVPGAGVLGILHQGQRLHAPHQVEGEWRVELAGQPAAAVMTIQQSGPYVSITLPGANDALDGTIDGVAVQAEPGAGCPKPRMRARLDRAARTLAGEIVGNDCMAVGFRATRAEQKKGGGAH